MRILILRGGALGDFLVTLPALRALRQRWPQATLELVGNRRAAELGLMDGCLDHVHDQHAARWAPLVQDAPLPAELAGWLDGFDLIVSYWPDHDGVLGAHLQRRRGRALLASAAVTSRPAAHHFLMPLETCGCHAEELAPVLRIPSAIQREAEHRLAGSPPLIAVHAGSGSLRKTWPLERWHELVARLDRPLLWIQGEADAGCAPPHLPGVVVAADWPLPVLAAALGRSTYYLGHDTGVSHLAAATGVEGLLLFGPTDPAIWAPPTPRLRILQGANGVIDAIPVEQVAAMITTTLGRGR